MKQEQWQIKLEKFLDGVSLVMWVFGAIYMLFTFEGGLFYLLLPIEILIQLGKWLFCKI